MGPSRRLVLISGAAALALPAIAAAQAPSLADLVARNTRARGGAAALDRVRSCLITLDIVERGRTLRGVYAADAAGLVRIDIHAGGAIVYSEGVDRAGVWLWPRSEPAARASSATGAANALLHGAENHLFGFHRFEERGHRLRLLPAETIDGADFPAIEATYSTGHISAFYLDPATGLITRRRDRRAYHPDADGRQQRVETRYLDYQPVDGVLAAHRNVDVDLDSGETLSTNRIIERRLNPVLAEDYYDRGFVAA